MDEARGHLQLKSAMFPAEDEQADEVMRAEQDAATWLEAQRIDSITFPSMSTNLYIFQAILELGCSCARVLERLRRSRNNSLNFSEF